MLKRVYKREELVAACSLGEYMCAFCRTTRTYAEEFRHARDCPFANEAVVAVEITTLTPARDDICAGCNASMCYAARRMSPGARTHETLWKHCRQYAHECAKRGP